jgi:rare lipoprotein A
MHFGSWAARAAALAFVFGGVIAADGGAKAPRTHVADAALYQSGLATWYGPDFEGARTACGYTFSSADYTAASNTLPCGAVVTVTNADTGHAVTVTITDRGAFRYPVILDLSRAAFNAIGDTYHGVINVTVSQ